MIDDALARMTDPELAAFIQHLKRETRKAQSLLAKAEREKKSRRKSKGVVSHGE